MNKVKTIAGLSTKIYEHLKEKGAEIGNASVFLIRHTIEKHTEEIKWKPKHYPQPKSTTEKIYKQIKRLQSVNDDLEAILATAGRDSETNYKKEYLDMLDSMKALRVALGVLLDDHQSVIMDVEYEMEPLPIKAPPVDLVEDILKPFFDHACYTR